MKYAPTSRVLPALLFERSVFPDEERVIAFLERGLALTLRQLEKAKRANTLGSAHDLQIQAITLRNVIDGIRAGLHDEKHAERVIEVNESVQFLFSMIPE